MKIYKYNINDLSDESYEHYRMLMSKVRRERLDRLRFLQDRKRSLCGYMLALKALSEESGIAENEITIEYDENGKPYSPLDISFSISHSGDFSVCATDKAKIGIDIEKIRSVNMQGAKRFATENELVYIFGHIPTSCDFSSTDEKTLERFFEIWTKKEAYGKLIGKGIAYSMKETEPENAVTKNEDGYIITVCCE